MTKHEPVRVNMDLSVSAKKSTKKERTINIKSLDICDIHGKSYLRLIDDKGKAAACLIEIPCEILPIIGRLIEIIKKDTPNG